MRKSIDLRSGMVKDILPVTPSDTTDIDGFVVGIYVTNGGLVSFESFYGGTREITVPDNFTLVCRISRVNQTNTTASDIHAYII